MELLYQLSYNGTTSSLQKCLEISYHTFQTFKIANLRLTRLRKGRGEFEDLCRRRSETTLRTNRRIQRRNWPKPFWKSGFARLKNGKRTSLIIFIFP